MIPTIVLIGSLIQFISGLAYLRETLLGLNKPNRVTWLLWAIAPLIASAAALTDGVGWLVLPVFLTGFNPTMIFLASFWNKKAYWKHTKVDYSFGIVSALALILWAITKEPNIAILFAIIADFLAAIPTYKKSWTHPESETGYSYMLVGIGVTSVLLATDSFSFSVVAFPIFLIVQNLIITSIIYRKKLGFLK